VAHIVTVNVVEDHNVVVVVPFAFVAVLHIVAAFVPQPDFVVDIGEATCQPFAGYHFVPQRRRASSFEAGSVVQAQICNRIRPFGLRPLEIVAVGQSQMLSQSFGLLREIKGQN
jgi:hypothetical protein